MDEMMILLAGELMPEDYGSMSEQLEQESIRYSRALREEEEASSI